MVVGWRAWEENVKKNDHQKTSSPLCNRMKSEVRCAVNFLSNLMVTSHLPYQFVEPFRLRLEQLLLQRFRGHWHTDKPLKGSAYRCIRINEKKLDSILTEAAQVTGLSDIRKYLPHELTLWIDPKDVSYRFGEDGSVSSIPLEEYRQPAAPTTTAPWTSDLSQLYNLPSYAGAYRQKYHRSTEISVEAS